MKHVFALPLFLIGALAPLSVAFADSSGCRAIEAGGTVNYYPTIRYKDKENGWVLAKTIGARKKECTNSCQRNYGKDASILWKIEKPTNAPLPSFVGLQNYSSIDDNAIFDCRKEFVSLLDAKDFPEISKISEINKELATLPPSAPKTQYEVRKKELRHAIEDRAKMGATCPNGLSRSAVTIHDSDDWFAHYRYAIQWICISGAPMRKAEICPAEMLPHIESGLSMPSETKEGDKSFAYIGLNLSCSPEVCPASSIKVGPDCVICPRATTFDAAETSAAISKMTLSQGFYLCKGARKSLEKLYKSDQ